MSNSQKKAVAAVIVFIIAVGVSAAVWAGQVPIPGFVFPRGTWIAGQNVSGLDKQEAAQIMMKRSLGFGDVIYNTTCDSLPDHAVKSADVGASLDIEAFIDQIMATERKRGLYQQFTATSRRSYPMEIPITYDRDKYLENMANLCPVLENPAKVFKINWTSTGEPYKVSGQSTVRIDREASFKSLPTVYRGEKALQWQLKGIVDPGSIDMDKVRDQVELASFVTWFDPGNINRTSNLKKAAKALHGATILPDHVFSFNDTVGPRDLSNGYLEAMVILKNEFTPGVGGGICQVSSTLYNAVLLSNLPIVERHNHSVAVPYLPPGLDATVVYRSRDFRFRNNTSYPISIKTEASGGRLKVSIMGHPDSKPPEVKIERQVLATTPFKEVRKVDPIMAEGTEKVDHNGVQGYSVKTFRNTYDSQGQLIKRELLAADRYTPLDKLILVGSKPITVEENPEPGLPPSDTGPDNGVPGDSQPGGIDEGGADPGQSDPVTQDQTQSIPETGGNIEGINVDEE